MKKEERNVFLIYPFREGIEDIIEIIKEFFGYYKEEEIMWNIKHAAEFRSSIDLLHNITISIKDCDLAIVILSPIRNNVAFELGILHALEKDYILLVAEPDLEKIKIEFSDISGLKYTTYDPHRILKLRDILARELNTLYKERENKIIKKHTPEYLIALGDAFFQQGLYSEAISKYKAAVGLKNDLYEAWVRIGDCQLQTYDLMEAEESFRKALSLRPHGVIAYDKLGQVLFESGQYELAIREYYERLVELQPYNTAYHYKIADLFCHAGTPDKSVEYLLNTIKKIGELPSLYYDCAWCCIRQSNKVSDQKGREEWIQKGLQTLKRAIELDREYIERAKKDRDFDSVRSRSDFVSILETLDKK